MLGEMNGDAGRMARMLARVPLGRLGAPADVSRAVCFLAPEAANYVVGLNTDGSGDLRDRTAQDDGALPRSQDAWKCSMRPFAGGGSIFPVSGG